MQDTLAGRLRPKIIAIVVLLIVQCLSGLYFSLILIAELLAPGHPVIVSGISIFTGFAAGVALVVALASPVIAWGLWTLKPWARQRCTLLELLSLGIGAFELLEPRLVSSIAPITCLVIAALILVVLYVGQDVRAAIIQYIAGAPGSCNHPEIMIWRGVHIWTVQLRYRMRINGALQERRAMSMGERVASGEAWLLRSG